MSLVTSSPASYAIGRAGHSSAPPPIANGRDGRFWTAPAERERDGAFGRTRRVVILKMFRPYKSGVALRLRPAVQDTLVRGSGRPKAQGANTENEQFEDVVKFVQDAAVLVLVYLLSTANTRNTRNQTNEFCDPAFECFAWFAVNQFRSGGGDDVTFFVCICK